MNSTIVLTRLIAARNAEGINHATTAAQNLLNTYYPGRTFDVQPVVAAVFGHVDAFDQNAAEATINEALATLNTPVPAPVVATDAQVAEDTTGHEARLVALEQIARNNGYGHDLAVPNGVGSHGARLTALENIARRANLR